MKRRNAIQTSIRVARRTWANLSREACMALAEITKQNNFSVGVGDLLYLNNHWYVTHTGPIRLARRKRYRGIHVEAVDSLCDSAANRFVLKAVYPSKHSAGFVDAEMRIADSRAVNRALPSLLSPVPLWFAFLAWRSQAIGVLANLCQGALEKELDLLIRRAVLPFREFSDPRFQAGSYSDKYGNSGLVHLQITKNYSC